MSRLETRNIDVAHETRKFQANDHVDVVTLGNFTLGRETFQPGWRRTPSLRPELRALNRLNRSTR